MAIDTQSKRASAVQFLTPYVLAPIKPDGTIATTDRQHAVWVYAGIAAAVAVVIAEELILTGGILRAKILRGEVMRSRIVIGEVARSKILVGER